MSKKKQSEQKLPIENRPVEELKKEAEVPVDFSALIGKMIHFDKNRLNIKRT